MNFFKEDRNWIPLVLLLGFAALILSGVVGCASSNYYGPRGLSSAQYETHGYVVITNNFNMVIFSGDCSYYWDEGDLIIGGRRYSSEKYNFSFGM